MNPMIQSPRWLFLLLPLSFLSFPAMAGNDADHQLLDDATKSFAALPDIKEADTLNSARVALGRNLFFEPRVSRDGTVSCARCHQPSLYGTDGLARSIGVDHHLNARNAPTVLNAALQLSQHWIGDRINVEDQAMKSLLGPNSFGQPNYLNAMQRLQAIPGYAEMFSKAYPDDKNPITPENWGNAIGAYERTLLTPAPFDQFLTGDTNAISMTAKSGLRKFMGLGCVGCHNGVGVGGNAYMKFGLTEDYWTATGSNSVDKGRYAFTKNEADQYVFKVPSLRNVTRTAPYFHDGSVASLEQAIRIMASVQLGKTLTEQDMTEIMGFLDSLTGPLPSNFAQVPVLP